MRISDWSSDVCSSDLVVQVRRRETAAVERHQRTQFGRDDRNDVQHHPLRTVAGFEEAFDNLQPLDDLLRLQLRLGRGQFFEELYLLALQRSEEHTSELQSLMRISYAVFCLKKKNKQM